MRQIILAILGLVLIGLSFLGMKKIMASKDKEKPVYESKVASVFVETAQNQEVSVEVKLTGRLEAVNKVNLFAETQGIFRSSRSFRPGTYYKKGATLISVDNRQELATLKAQRSSLINQIVRFLPDLKFDYPEAYEKWDQYVNGFDVNATTPPLPEPASKREKFFIASQNVSSSYYNIKTLESRLSKYRIYAPFSGILTEALVQPGALISPGQRLGTFVGQSSFELALPVREEYLPLLKVGQTLDVVSKEDGQSYKGKLVRINPVVDPSSQSVTIYVSLSGQQLREGMFFEATLPLEPFNNAIEVDRKLLVSNQYLFAADSDTLKRVKVTPVHYNSSTVVVQGAPDGTQILSRVLPGARSGMSINIIEE